MDDRNNLSNTPQNDGDEVNQHFDVENMFDDWENYHQYMSDYQKPDLDNIWQRVIQLLGWEKKKTLISKINPVLRYAAAILLPILGLFYWYYLSDDRFSPKQDDLVTIETSRGISTRINLADGSSVWLRPGSSLSYPEYFDYERRELSLEGEAFFNIHSDREWPFVITTGMLDVIVTGTKITLKSFPEEDLIEAGLVTGSARIEWTDADYQKVQQDMNQMEILIFSKEHRGVVDTHAMSHKAASWNHFNLSFDATPFGDLMMELANWYNVQIEFHPNAPTDKPVTMTVHEESLTEILDILQIIVDFDYELSRNRLLLIPVE